MEMLGNLPDHLHKQVVGQHAAQPLHHPVRLHRYVRVEVCELLFGMDPGIGAPRSVQRNILLQQGLQGLLQRALHRPGIRLLLPAEILRPVIGKLDHISGHNNIKWM
jgi:hypothetical protein